MNMLAGFAIGHAAGLPVEAMLAAAKEFRGVAHRLEFVRELAGVKWYNDSIATAPERTMADIRSFDEPIVLLLGGRDKNLPWDELAGLCRQRVDHVVLFGEAAEKISRAFGSLVPGQRPLTLERCHGLQDAVHAAARIASPGDLVLLAPGGTSFDEFRDFEERGEGFRKWVSELL
jgi:UDP-N-acetylmuramoylalanine--D-glutamate ligase